MKDTIYREDAIKALEQRYEDILRIFKRKVKDGEKAIALDMIGCVKSLPPADRPQGKWKRGIVDYGFNADWKCSECGYKVFTDFVGFNYCPNCGCRMKGADDEVR